MKPSHTQLPWKANGNEVCGIADCCFNRDKEDRANAELIVKAVNNHYKLLEACKVALEAMGHLIDDVGGNAEKGYSEEINIIKEAIKSVEA